MGLDASRRQILLPVFATERSDAGQLPRVMAVLALVSVRLVAYPE